MRLLLRALLALVLLAPSIVAQRPSSDSLRDDSNFSFYARGPYRTNVPRPDLIAAFLTGVDGLNKHPNVVASEMLRLNTSIAPTRKGRQSRLGVLGGDTAGFPNGRRPADDVVDIELRVAMGVLCTLNLGGCKPADALAGGLRYTDGAFISEVFFSEDFPYLRAPLRGSPNDDNAIKKQRPPGR